LDFGALLDALFGLGAVSRTVDFRVGARTIHVSVPEDSIFFSLKDILYNREYELYPQFELMNPREVIVDAGANAGLYTIIASLFAKKVIALEPDLGNFTTLLENLKLNGVENVIALKSALWSTDGAVKFHKRRSSQLGSIKVHADSKNVEAVEAVSLRGLLSTIDGTALGHTVDLLKLDIEGAEFDVILSCGPQTLESVSRIVAEIHTEHGDYQELTRKLRQSKFSYVVLDRPARKTPDEGIRVISDYRVKLLITIVDGIIALSHYHDWSSLLLYASKDASDFHRHSQHRWMPRVVESHIF